MAGPKHSTAVMARRGAVLGSTPLLDDGGGMAEQLGLIPAGGSAVMATRQAEQPNPFDYFPTPPFAARAGGEWLRRLDPLAKVIDEPGCGGGHMAFGLADTFGAANVRCSDIADHGLVAPFNAAFRLADYLDPDWSPGGDGEACDWVVTNPPFLLAEQFVRLGWARARRGVAVLLRSVFIESTGRHGLFMRDCPLGLKADFAERVPMHAGHWDPEGDSATAYSWFFFPKPECLETSPLGGAIAAAAEAECFLETIIGPGTRARLSKAADLVAFGPASIAFMVERAAALTAQAHATPAGAAKLLAKAKELRAHADTIAAAISTPSLFASEGNP
jgi:hypothetical protein